jgi:hypothetical protein
VNSIALRSWRSYRPPSVCPHDLLFRHLRLVNALRFLTYVPISTYLLSVVASRVSFQSTNIMMSICLSCIHAGHCESTVASHSSWPVSAKIAYRTYGLSHLQWPVPHFSMGHPKWPYPNSCGHPSKACPIQSGLSLSPAFKSGLAKTGSWEQCGTFVWGYIRTKAAGPTTAPPL